jgi:hypothetical protein
VGIGAVRAALMAAAVVAFFYAVPAAGNQPRAYGRELVAQYQLPADAIARYTAVAAAAAHSETMPRERAARSDDAFWIGPQQAAGVGRNPYTLVLTVSGVARAAGNVHAQWRAGWEVHESPAATREVLMSVNAQHAGATASGAPVTLTAVSAPLSFRGERQVAPLLNLVEVSNLDISDVYLQVWSGSAPFVAWPALSAPRPAWLGLGTLCLLMWFFFRRPVRARAAPAAPSSRLPQNDLQALLEHRQDSADRLHPLPRAAPPPRDHASHVVTALRDVLLNGLVVRTELDETRHPRNARVTGS